jgi:ABC-type nitrate/sulfonate/bicarbonate transport system ATPase subunit
VIAHVVDEAVLLTHRMVLLADRPGTKFAEAESPSMAMAGAG